MPKKAADADEVLEILRTRDREEYPVVTAGQVAELIDASRPVATDRLEKLEERGVMKKTRVGQARAWWLKGEKMSPEAGEAEEISVDVGDGLETPDGGASAEGELGELVENVSDIRGELHQLIDKVERLDEQVARAQNSSSEEPEEAAKKAAEEATETVGEWISHHEYKEKERRVGDHAIGGFLLMFLLGIWGTFYGGGDIVSTFAGIVLLYAVVQGARYLFLRGRGPQTEEATETETSSERPT